MVFLVGVLLMVGNIELGWLVMFCVWVWVRLVFMVVWVVCEMKGWLIGYWVLVKVMDEVDRVRMVVMMVFVDMMFFFECVMLSGF